MEIYPNLTITYKILLFCYVASAELLFLKLKLIKNKEFSTVLFALAAQMLHILLN